MNNLTTEQKARIFAMYIGRECRYPNNETFRPTTATLTGVSTNEGLETTYKRRRKSRGGHHGYISGDLLSFTPNGNHDVDALHTKLLLRPLSAITDEDAIEVGRLLFETGSDKLNAINGRLFRDRLCDRDFKKHNPVPHPIQAHFIFQFLIQQGYAVPLYIAPNHPDNGRDAIELGLAIEPNL